MKKRLKKNSKRRIFIYSVIGAFLIFSKSVMAETVSSSLSNEPSFIDSLESTIQSLINPFLPSDRFKKDTEIVPEKTIEIPKDLSQPVPEAIFVSPEPIVAPVVPIVEQKPIKLEPVPPEIFVSGIIYNTARPMAIINGEVLEEGQTLDLGQSGGKVVVRSIKKGQVVVRSEGKDFYFGLDGIQKKEGR